MTIPTTPAATRRQPTPEVADLASAIRRLLATFETGTWTDSDLQLLAELGDWYDTTGKDLARQRAEAANTVLTGQLFGYCGACGRGGAR